MFDDPIGLDGALRAAPLTPSAAPIVFSSSSWLEQQELAEVLEEQLTELEALEAIEVIVRDSTVVGKYRGGVTCYAQYA